MVFYTAVDSEPTLADLQHNAEGLSSSIGDELREGNLGGNGSLG